MSINNRLQLSKHFCENWQCRVGKYPTPEEIVEFMRCSVRVQPCRDLREKNGDHFRMLAIYWNPDLDLVIKVDKINNKAVTVLSRENLSAKRTGCRRASHKWAGPRRRRQSNGSYISLGD